MFLTVFILDYQRFPNIVNSILPRLLLEPSVNQIIISHGSFAYENANHHLFPHLEQNEIQTFDLSGKQIVRIQDDLNPVYECFRRWIWIEKLYKKNYIKNSYILTHDDDFYFQKGQIQRLFHARKKGICICGSGGRLLHPYLIKSVNGPCPIAIGKSMLISVENVITVCQEVKRIGIPTYILHEDDIIVSLILGKGESVHYGVYVPKFVLPSPYARCFRTNHLMFREQTAIAVLRYIKAASLKPNYPPHLHSLSTTDDKLMTSLTTDPHLSSQ
jgi:hypothetical protein